MTDDIDKEICFNPEKPRRERFPFVDLAKNQPACVHKSKQQFNKMQKKKKLKDFEKTGIPELDEILEINSLRLEKNSWLVRSYGCKRCPWRGTDRCPHDIDIDETHANGYCNDRMLDVAFSKRAMGSVSGMRLKIRNHVLDLEDYLQDLNRSLTMLRAKRHSLEDKYGSGEVTDKELKILDMMGKVRKLALSTIENEIKQKEGHKLHVTNKINDDQLNEMYREWQSKTIEGEVVDDDDNDKGDNEQ